MGLFLCQMGKYARQDLNYVHLLADEGFYSGRMGLCDVDVELFVDTGFWNVCMDLSDLLDDTDSFPEAISVDGVGFVIGKRNCNWHLQIFAFSAIKKWLWLGHRMSTKFECEIFCIEN